MKAIAAISLQITDGCQGKLMSLRNQTAFEIFTSSCHGLSTKVKNSKKIFRNIIASQMYGCSMIDNNTIKYLC